jgi:hypothetical protein
MIASQKIGKSFMGALDYNIRKLTDPGPGKRAELLDTNFTMFSRKQIKTEIAWVRQQRPTLNRYVYHTSLNFLEQETKNLDNGKLLTIAHDYLEGMGFTNNQYLILRHYDTDHPHIHILANRICFDGQVVSDSNNFKRSEALLRKLERRYNLIPVYQSNYVAHKNGTKDIVISRTKHMSNRAPKKDEIEISIRTGEASGKMLLQETLSRILQQPKLSMQDFVQQCELNGIALLFNQASTGRISGITYFQGNFKAKGQALGSRFKWTGLLKHLDYEQNRDSETVSQANSGTKAKYGEFNQHGERSRTEQGSDQFIWGGAEDSSIGHRQRTADGEFGSEAYPDREGPLAANQDADPLYRDTADTLYHDTSDPGIYIADDIDDEAILGKDRRRQKKARINTR